MRHDLSVQILKGMLRGPPGLSGSASDEWTIDLEPNAIEQGLNVDATQGVVEEHDDFGLTCQIPLQGLRELAPLFFRAVLDLALASYCAMNIVTAEAHECQREAILGELVVGDHALHRTAQHQCAVAQRLPDTL